METEKKTQTKTGTETVFQEINVCVICMRKDSLNEDNVWMFELNLVQDDIKSDGFCKWQTG